MMGATHRLGSRPVDQAANLCLNAGLLTLTKAKTVTGHRLSGKSRVDSTRWSEVNLTMPFTVARGPAATQTAPATESTLVGGRRYSDVLRGKPWACQDVTWGISD